jgi:hypothetical protein
MESLRYVLICLSCGIIAVWAGENMFWFAPPHDLRPTDLAFAVIAYSIASGVGLSLVILSGIGGLPAAFLGGAVMGYMAEGVIVGTIYDPLPFFWVWTPLAWHALISGGLVLGLGRAGGRLGPLRMALIWGGLGLACWRCISSASGSLSCWRRRAWTGLVTCQGHPELCSGSRR